MTIATTEGQLAHNAFPLTPLQEGMLFHHLTAPDSGVDIEQMVIELHEEVDPKLLETAWSETVQNQPVLRTEFAWDDLVQPVQRETDSAVVAFTVTDLRGLSAEEAERQIAEYLAQDRTQGFDLQQAPLMRLQLFTTAEDKHQLIWTFHHILIDGRSFGTILDEAFGRYQALRTGAKATPEPGKSFREYVSWLSRLDTSGATEFWRNKLQGVAHPTPLPFSPQKREGAVQHAFGEAELHLAPQLTAALHELGATAKFSLNNLVMGAWAVLLYRYSGEQEVVFGSTKTTRRSGLEGAEDMVGLFLATLPIRLSVTPEQSFQQLLSNLREYWVAIRAHENTPLVEIKRASTVAGDAQLFDSLVVFENNQFGKVLSARGGDWANRKFELLEQTNHGLTLCAYGGEQLKLKLDFDARRFERRQAVQLLHHLEIILQRIVSDLDSSVGGFPLLTSDERSQVLGEFNATELEYPREVSLGSLIEASVERSPDATAVVFGKQRLTYRELNARANRLAREMQKHGAGPGKLVGLYVDRSTEMLVGLLAIVKTGSGYLPLDPFLPTERLEFMLADSGVGLVLTERGLQSDLGQFRGQFVLFDDAGWQSNVDSNLDVLVDADSVAYVLYTSGSTGRPKGVQVPRGALSNLLFSMRKWLQFTAGDRLLAVTTISFDIAGVDMWLPLLVGAQTVLATREQASDGDQLLELMTSHKITFLQATPVTWWLLLGADWEGDSGLQAVCTGEAMPRDLATQLFPKTGRLWNLYGPTETTIWSTGFQITIAGEPVLIGRPVNNTQCFILDNANQPVPLGATGELYIAGDGLATGYLNRPELTAEKFVVNPFSSVPAARMYRTGDLARYHTDGQIECLGRTDHQVKIRGYRIELGEIETLLKTLPDVEQAVVVAREDVPGDKRLIAYLVFKPGVEIDRVALRDHLKAHLPLYMIPSDYVVMESIPINPNGKIDRNRLPAPKPIVESVSEPKQTPIVTESDGKTGRRSPANRTKRTIYDIFRNVLGLGTTRIGVDTNFFDLGGNSLSGVRVISQINKEVSATLPTRTLFEAQTVTALADAVESRIGKPATEESEDWPVLIPIQANGNKVPLFCVARPNVNALGYVFLARQLGDDQPVYGLQRQLPEDPSVEFTEEQFQEVARSSIQAMRSVQPEGPYNLIGLCQGAYIAFAMTQQLEQQGQKVSLLGMLDTWPEENTRIKWLFFANFYIRVAPRFAFARLKRIFRRKTVTTAPNTCEAPQAATETNLAKADSTRRWKAYWPGKDFVVPVCHTKITAFRVEEQFLFRPRDPSLGWKDRTTAGFEAESILGDHLTLLREPYVSVLAAKIAERLAKSEQHALDT